MDGGWNNVLILFNFNIELLWILMRLFYYFIFIYLFIVYFFIIL